jgi:hypothetical protein
MFMRESFEWNQLCSCKNVLIFWSVFHPMVESVETSSFGQRGVPREWRRAIWFIPLILTVLASQTSSHVAERTSAPKGVVCSDPQIWNERFQYAESLGNAGDLTGEKRVLEPALATDCQTIRFRALTLLKPLIRTGSAGGWPGTVWRFFEPALLNLRNAIAWVVIVGSLLALAWIPARYFQRRSLAVRPLLASGSSNGFDGRHFVSIAEELAQELRVLDAGPVGLPASSATVPKMLVDSITLPDEVLGIFPDNQAGKILTVLLGILRKPRYSCSGSVHFSGRNTHFVVRVQRGRRILDTCERSSTPARMIEDLKDLGYWAIETARTDLRRY